MAATATPKLDRLLPEFDPLKTEIEAADFLSIKPQTLAVWRTTKRYHLPYVKVGRAVRYRQSDLQRFIEERTENGNS